MEIGKERILSIVALIVFLVLVIISYFILKPLIIPIISGIILAYLLFPIYKFSLKGLKSKNLTAFIICLLFLAILGISLWLGARALSDQAFEFYKNVKEYDIVGKVSDFLSRSIIKDEELANQVASTIKIGLLKAGRGITEAASNFVSNIFIFFLQLFVAFFIMFYFLRDGEKIYRNIYSLLPFKENIRRRFEKRTKEVTRAVIYGRFLIGIIQGLTAGIGFYVFGVKQPLLFTVLSIFFSILPFLGAWLVWIPVSINFIFAAGWQLGILHFLYHLIITNQIDNVVSPYIVGRSAKMNNATALVGMVGGVLSFGAVGLIIGPLVLEYLFIFIDIYKKYIGKT